jgi:uncharacterized protein (TIRG00374 family)
MEAGRQQIALTPTSPTQERRGSWIRGLLQVVIGIGALGFVIYKADARGLLEALRATKLAYLPFALLAVVTVNWLMAYRWGLVLRVRGHRTRTRRLFVYYLIGIFFMNFVPGGGVSGDVARLIYAGREIRDKPFVLSTLVYERMVALFALLLIGFVATLASRTTLPEGRAFYVGEAALGAAFLASTMLMSDYLSSRLVRGAKWLGKRIGLERLGEALSRTFEAMRELRGYKAMLAKTLALSILIRIVWGLGWYVVVLAMGLPLSLPVVIAFVSLVDLIRMMPISVGGLGVREWAIIVLFGQAGIDRDQALMFSFLVFTPILLNAIAGGILYIARAGLSLPGARRLTSE